MKTSLRRPRIVPSWATGDLNLAIRLARVIHRGQVLTAVLDPADRATDMPGGKRDEEVLWIELAAGAEAAADIVFNQIDMRGSESKHCGQGIAIKEWHLGGAEHGHSSLRPIPLGE